MAIVTNRINYYRVASVQRHDAEEGIEIKLYESHRGGSSRNIAILTFSSTDRLPRVTWPATGVIGPVRVQYRMESYARIIDILRNEKPLSLVTIRNWNSVSIKSGNEPIGEEES